MSRRTVRRSSARGLGTDVGQVPVGYTSDPSVSDRTIDRWQWFTPVATGCRSRVCRVPAGHNHVKCLDGEKCRARPFPLARPGSRRCPDPSPRSRPAVAHRRSLVSFGPCARLRVAALGFAACPAGAGWSGALLLPRSGDRAAWWPMPRAPQTGSAFRAARTWAPARAAPARHLDRTPRVTDPVATTTRSSASSNAHGSPAAPKKRAGTHPPDVPSQARTQIAP